MRNSTNIVLSQAEPTRKVEETTLSLSGAFIGFLSWLLALGIPFVVYGPNTLFFFLYTWPFFLALLPVGGVIGIALHAILRDKLLLSCVATLLCVVLMVGVLFMWLMG